MDSVVTVDDDFARFGNKSFAIDKINTVEVREWRPYGLIGAVLFGALALIWVFFAFNSTDGTSAVVTLGLAVLSAIGAYWAWRRRTLVEYKLFLMTSSSETQAFVSKDRSEVQSLRDSIEGAMAKRILGTRKSVVD